MLLINYETMIYMTKTLSNMRTSNAVAIMIKTDLIINQTDLQAYKNAARSKVAPANASSQSRRLISEVTLRRFNKFVARL